MPVFLIAGSWEFSDKGIWDFYIAKECYARSISMTSDMSYEELLLRVRTEFELHGLELKPKLSYWLPCQLSVFSLNSRPPVMITSSMSIRNFLAVKETAVHLNLLLSLEHESVDDVGTRMRQICSVPAAKGNDIGGNDTAAAFAALEPIVPTKAQKPNLHDNKFSGVRRRLFGENEASGSDGPIMFLSVQPTAPVTCTDSEYITESGVDNEGGTEHCGIIRLADAATPSLSHHSEDGNMPAPELVQNLLCYEDDDFIREVEAVENRELQVRMLKGKAKCKESGEEFVNNGSDDSYTDGVGCSGSDMEISDEDIWTLAFDKEYPIDFSPPGFTMAQADGVAASEPIVQSPEHVPGEEDIGTSVLLYLESERKIREDFDANQGGNAFTDNQCYEGFASPAMGVGTGLTGGLTTTSVGANTEEDTVPLAQSDVSEGTPIAESPEHAAGEEITNTGDLLYLDSESQNSEDFDDNQGGIYPNENHYGGFSSPGMGIGTVMQAAVTDSPELDSPELREINAEPVPSYSTLGTAYTGEAPSSSAFSAVKQTAGQWSSIYSAVPVSGLTLEELGGDYTQRRDAEPVIDDAFELTNTDGCATVSAEEDAIYIGRIFKDKEDFRNTLAIYAIKRLFHFRQLKSDPKRVICVCIDSQCKWRVFAHRVSEFSDNFEIPTATLTHSCSILARSQYEKQASAKVIAEVLKGKYANGLPGPRAIDIPDIVLAELKVSVTYMKAWYAKEAAIMKSRGSDEKSYKLLAVYMYLLEKGNPGTVYRLEYTGGGLVPKQFKYLFFALGASIAGIKFMRKVVLVDGTAIKTKFKGVLMAASMQDANFQVYPIAFAIVDAENDLAWTWFFTQLSQLLPDAADFVIVSDRHRSIYAAVRKVYPLAFHGACAVHIERNVRAKSPGTGISALVGKAARAFNVGDFKEWYNEIVKRSKKCAAYLDAIPLEHWTQAYCQARRYNIMSSNIAEALNGAIAKFVELPIVSIVESLRTKLMEWFCFRREKGNRLLSLGETITPKVNDLILRHHQQSAGLPVKAVSEWTFEVTVGLKKYYVDLELKTCTCLQFQKLQIPCCHALAAARKKGVAVPTLVGTHYTVPQFRGAYEMLIFPVPNESDEDIPPSVQETEFMPPDNKNGPGRRRKRRIPSIGEYLVRYFH